MSWRWALTLGLLLMLLSETALAVSCYECDSVNDLYCGDDFQPDDIAKTDCDSMELPEEMRAYYLQRPETACLTKYYKGSPGESLFVRRSCAFGDLSVCDEQPDPVVPQLSFLGCVFCHKDLCNGQHTNNSGVSTLNRNAFSIFILFDFVCFLFYFYTSTKMI